MKKVRSSQAAILVLDWIKHSFYLWLLLNSILCVIKMYKYIVLIHILSVCGWQRTLKYYFCGPLLHRVGLNRLTDIVYFSLLLWLMWQFPSLRLISSLFPLILDISRFLFWPRRTCQHIYSFSLPNCETSSATSTSKVFMPYCINIYKLSSLNICRGYKSMFIQLKLGVNQWLEKLDVNYFVHTRIFFISNQLAKGLTLKMV